MKHNLAHYTDEILCRIRISIDTLVMYLRCHWWCVDIGKEVRCHGTTHIKRLQDSTIVIGDRCTFLSTSTSNKIGLCAPCMLSTAERGARLQIGNGCGFSGTRIWASLSIIIGNNVRCGANSIIVDTDAHTDDPRAGENAPVVIEDDVWIGMNVTVLKGVTIGKGSMIAAGSIVTKDIPQGVVAGGVPCRVIKKL